MSKLCYIVFKDFRNYRNTIRYLTSNDILFSICDLYNSNQTKITGKLLTIYE